MNNGKLLIRAAVFDLDGTLLRTDKSVSAYTLEVLERCRKKGILLGIATARAERQSQRQKRWRSRRKRSQRLATASTTSKCWNPAPA